ncbi:extracellular solute-binding protein [Lyngbya confervoides]|uniref:Substrate-binding domain-containing protein n=1 Tax=Lyngbya confervoides BDU141951 TaxID=1574623 RepID=A0ABD4T2L7_9CYAN|nr:extracellular solute-binding protein [Lyngbya confervoides]MCM1982850.1 substrate-binding domain-containing protein [Lyngbya confervoides BDU141951]
MNRRTFLRALGGVTVSSLLAGCQSSPGPRLQIYAMRQVLPPQLLRRFQQETEPVNVDLALETSPARLFGLLQRWQQDGLAPDHPRLVSLGDYWLTQAIREGLIDPLVSPQTEAAWPLGDPWQQLVRRNDRGLPDSQGPLWAAPYRWGATVLVYRRDKLQDLNLTLRDWRDLWHPQLQGRISLLNQPREVIGMVLKTLGYSYNHVDLGAVQNLETQLRLLDQQVRFYSSNHYLQPLLLGDTWVAMGWSTDGLAALDRDANLAVVFPESGTAVWADCWVQARQSPATDWVTDWVNFWWQPEIGKALSSFTFALSVIPQEIRDPAGPTQELLAAQARGLAQSDPLYPLPPATLAQYGQLWQQMRSAA